MHPLTDPISPLSRDIRHVAQQKLLRSRVEHWLACQPSGQSYACKTEETADCDAPGTVPEEKRSESIALPSGFWSCSVSDARGLYVHGDTEPHQFQPQYTFQPPFATEPGCFPEDTEFLYASGDRSSAEYEISRLEKQESSENLRLYGAHSICSTFSLQAASSETWQFPGGKCHPPFDTFVDSPAGNGCFPPPIVLTLRTEHLKEPGPGEAPENPEATRRIFDRIRRSRAGLAPQWPAVAGAVREGSCALAPCRRYPWDDGNRLVLGPAAAWQAATENDPRECGSKTDVIQGKMTFSPETPPAGVFQGDRDSNHTSEVNAPPPWRQLRGVANDATASNHSVERTPSAADLPVLSNRPAEEKKMERRLRNKVAARRSREKRNRHVKDLETERVALLSQNNELNGVKQLLISENEDLRRKLENATQSLLTSGKDLLTLVANSS